MKQPRTSTPEGSAAAAPRTPRTKSPDEALAAVERALAAHGLNVPSDVKLVGFDDILLAEHFHPALTTVRQSMDIAGPALVQMLADQLQGIARGPLTLPAELIIRESSGAHR